MKRLGVEFNHSLVTIAPCIEKLKYKKEKDVQRNGLVKHKKLYFVRHGESVANLLWEVSNRGFKHGLTDRGFQQAKDLGRSLRTTPFAKIYTSPLKRAWQTAQILGKILDIPLEITEALREYDCGILEGRSDPEGESHFDIQARFVPFIKDLIQKDQNDHILCVGHEGTYRAVMPIVFANIDMDFVREIHIEHTTPIIAELRDGDLYCIQWGKWRFESQEN